jgi:transposase
MATWKRSGRCASLVAARSKPAPRLRISSTHSSRPHPTTSEPVYGNSQSLLAATASRFRSTTADPAALGTKIALGELAHRWQHLTDEIGCLDQHLDQLVTQTAPALVARSGIGTDTAGALLVAAGDNPDRLTSEAAFAALCGVSPLDASSGLQRRHRLNRGGDRHANNALWRIALVRMSHCPRTRAYVERRTQEGRTKREIIRCLKRHIAREIYTDLRNLDL